MNLSEIKFSVETSALKEAIGTLKELRTATNAVTENAKARKESIAVERAEIKLQQDKEKAAQAAMQTEEKALKLAKEKQRATSDNNSIVEETVAQLAASDKMLEKQTLSMKILRGETIQLGDATFSLGEGFTKSQANQLALMKLIGGTAEQMQILSGSFREYNAITGLNTFDKSASGLSKLNKELQELNQVDRLVKEGLALTRDEVVNLARDLERLKQVYVSEGRSAKELAQAEEELKRGYIETTGVLNTRRQASVELEKQAKAAASAEIKAAQDQSKATSYVEKELEKVRFALEDVNKEYNRGSANSILRFQKALEASGMTLDDQKKKLQEYRIAQQALQKAGGDRAVDYISRAVGPQITDILVGLSTGQSPLMVLLQQGGQLRDQFALAGVASADMAEVMRKSMKEMTSSIFGVGKAIGTFLVTGLYDAGKAVSTGFVESIKQASISANAFKIEMLLGKKAAEEYTTAVNMGPPALNNMASVMSKILAIPFAATIIGATVALVGYGVAVYQNIKAESELSKAIALTGARMGVTQSQAIALAESTKGLGVSQKLATEVLTQMAKAGNLSAESYKSIVLASQALVNTGLMNVEEAVKAFSKFGDDPVKALRELNIATGQVRESVISEVDALMKQGKTQEAVNKAVEEGARVQRQAASEVEKNMGYIETILNSVSKVAKSAWEAIWGWGAKDSNVKQLEAAKAKLADMQDLKKSLPGIDISGYQNAVKVLQGLVDLENKQSDAAKSVAAAEKAREDAVKDATKAEEKQIRNTWLATKSIEEYKKARFDQDYKSKSAKDVFSANPLAMAGKMKEYADEWEAAQKKISGPQVKDNALANLQSQFQSQIQLIKEQQSAKMQVLKAQRSAEFITEEEFRKGMVAAQSEYYNQSFTELTNSNKRKQKELDDLKNKAKGNAAALKNVAQTQETLNANFDNDILKLQVEVFGDYTRGIYEAAKALADYGRELKKVQKDENDRRSDIALDMELSVAKTRMSDRDFTAFAARKKEELRVQKQLDDLESKRKTLTDNVTTATGAYETAKGQAGTPANVLRDLATASEQAKNKLEEMNTAYGQTKALIGSPTERGAEAGANALKTRAAELKTLLLADTKSLDIGSTLAAGFDSASNSLGGLIGGLNQLIEFQEKLNQIEKDGSVNEEDRKKIQRAQISSYAKMSGESKKFFKQHTAGYKILDATEKAFRAAELGLAIKSTAEKLGLLDMEFWAKKATQAKELGLAILGQTQTTAATEAGFLARAGIYASEIMAKFTAMMGPWGLAAGAAAIAALGLGAFGSSGSFVKYNEGTGTVLGDKSKGSTSLSSSLEKLKDINNLSLQTSQSMLKSLEAIDLNTRGLSAIIAGSMTLEQETGKVKTGWANSETSRMIDESMKWADSFLGTGDFFQNTIGKLGTQLFGSSTKIKGQGITGSAQSLGDILSGGFQGQYFTDVETKKKFLGVTRKRIRSTNYTELDTDAEDQITKIFSGIYDTILTASTPLGFAFDTVSENLKNFIVDIGKVDTYGLTGEQIQERLTAVFSAAGDKIAEQAIPGLKEFQKVGEGYYETVIRVASGTEEAKFYLDKLNISSVKYTELLQKQGDVALELVRQSILAKEGATGIAGIIELLSGTASEMTDTYTSLDNVRTAFTALGISGDAVSMALLRGSGGVDALQSAMSSFQDSFLTDSEKIALTSAQMQKEFGKLGIVMPSTAEQFKALVLGVDTTSDSGKELLGRILGLSEGFSVLADEAKRIQEERIGLEEEILQLQGNETEIRRRQLEALDPSNRALQEQVWLLESQKKATEDAAKANEDLINSLKQAGKTIADEIKRLLGVSTGSSSAGLQAEFAIKTASARAGSLDALNALPDLSKSLETLLVGQASSAMEAARIRASLAGSLEETLRTLGISQDSSGSIQVGSSLQGSTSGNPSSGTLIVDNTNQELLAELKTLNTKVADLEAAAVSTALSNAKIQRLLDRVAADGNSFSIVVNTEAGPVSVDQV